VTEQSQWQEKWMVL